MKNRSASLLILLGLVGIAGITYGLRRTATEKPKVAIFNLLSHPILNDSIMGIKAGLADEGYGADSIQIIEVNANGEMDKLNAFAKELLAAEPSVIVPVSTPVTQAVFKEAAATQKIIFSTVTNPSDVGMEQRPANMTGVCDRVNYKASFDLIFELFTKTKTIGVIYNAGERNSQFGVDEVKRLAERRAVKLKFVTVAQSQEVVDAARSLIGNVDAIYVGSDNTVAAAMAGLTRVAHEAHVPVIASDSGSVKDGALAAVSVDYEMLGRRVGEMVAQVLRTGQMPGSNSPVIFTGDKLMLNEKAAALIDYQFPRAVRERAQEVIR